MKALKAALLSMLAAAALMTGCSDSKTDTDVEVDIGDIKADTDVSIDISDIEKDYKTNQLTQMDFVFDTDKNVSEFGVSIDTGNITIEYSRDNKTGLSLEYTVYSDTEEVCKEVKSHLNAIAETNGSRLDIRLIEDKTQEDISSWLRKNIPDCRVEYDLYITVPEFVSSFEAKENVGNLTFGDICGKFSGIVGVGNITCTGSQFTESSVIKCDTGNIAMSDCIYKADTDITADTGNITFCLPLNGSGGADISVKADTGNIKMTGIKNYDVKSENKKDTSHSLSIEVENCNIGFAANTGKIIIDKE